MVTLKEIAKAVGVSSTTVSRVLNFDVTLSITEGKRQAIIETAEALNYATPRARNRANRQGLYKIALIHFLRPEEELVDPYYVALRLGIESRCQELKIETVKVYHTDQLPDTKVLQGAAGVIVIGQHESDEIDWITRIAPHVVFADYTPPGYVLDSVDCDLTLAMHTLLNTLTDAGYARIGFVGWDEVRKGIRYPGTEIRGHAFEQWMRARGSFDPRFSRSDGKTEQSGYRLAREILAHPDHPQVLVACNDNIAVGIYRAASELGLKIPGDIAVASFNDISAAQFLNPPLTTIHLPAKEIGEAAVELLLERVSGRELAKHITLATTLRRRGSARLPKAKVAPR